MPSIFSRPYERSVFTGIDGKGFNENTCNNRNWDFLYLFYAMMNYLSGLTFQSEVITIPDEYVSKLYWYVAVNVFLRCPTL